jgi:hypothetical protein
MHALGRAYVDHALAHPDQYRIMFQLERTAARKNAESAEPGLRGWRPLRTTIAEAVAAGALRGDADEIAHVAWSALHGLVTLHLAGKLGLGRDLDSLVEPTIDLLLAGARAQPRPRKRRTR